MYKRQLQFTPPGSACSVIFGKNVTAAAPGSAQGLYLIVSDLEAARKEMIGRGGALGRGALGVSSKGVRSGSNRSDARELKRLRRRP